jgi:hypothetical protein
VNAAANVLSLLFLQPCEHRFVHGHRVDLVLCQRWDSFLELLLGELLVPLLALQPCLLFA